MKTRFKISKLNTLVLIIYVFWRNVLIGVKWGNKYEPFMNTIGRITMIVIILLLCFLYVRNSKHKEKRQLLLELSAIGISIISYYVTNSNILVFTFFIIFSTSYKSVRDIVSNLFKLNIFSILLILLVYFRGLSIDTLAWSKYGYSHSMGTYHANNFGILVASTYMMYFYIDKRKKILRLLIIGFLVIIPLWYFTYSRTSVILIIFCPVIYYLLYKIDRLSAFKFGAAAKWIVIIALLVSVYLTVNYSRINNGILSDGTFLSRFSNAFMIFKTYGIKLFGSNIQFVDSVTALKEHINVVILDAAYLRLILNYGILCTIAFMWIEYLSLRNTYIQKDYCMLCIAVVFAISGISESSVMMLQYNFTLLCAGNWFMNMKRGTIST